MSIAAATFIAKPMPYDCGISYKDKQPSKDVVDTGHSAARLDEPGLCAPWPWPLPHHLDALAGLISSPLGALAQADGHCGNGSGPRPPLPHGF